MIKPYFSKFIARKQMFFAFVFLLFLCTSKVYAQQDITVTGTVSDSEGILSGVNVFVKGTTIGSVSDINGNYTINVPNENSVIVFSFIGFIAIEEKVGDRRVIDVLMSEDAWLMDEVVVIGYGTVARKDVTTAVSVVSTKDLDERPMVSAVQAIQGKAAGVNVYMPNGTPGADMVIRVRGTTSFTGSNEPLYVVDGVPVDNIKFLSPNDIAGLHIMKDASGAAIYGSRAANGVVLITTKQATGDAKISLSAQYGVKQLTNKIESLNAAQYKELMDEILPANTIPFGELDRTDWHKEVYTTGIIQNYQLQVTDGNEKLKYLISGGYLDEKGVISSAFFKRYNFRASVDNQIRKWLNVNANINYSDNSQNGITTGRGSNRGGVVLAIINLPTSSLIKNDEGVYNRSFNGLNIANPMEAIENGKNNKNQENRIIASGSATITFVPELNLKSMFSLDRRSGLITGFTPPVHFTNSDDPDDPLNITDWGEGWDDRTLNTVLTFDNVLTYHKRFERHYLEIMGGSSWTESDWRYSYINGTHFKDGEIHTLNAANKISWTSTHTNASQWAIMSYFGRVSYNFDGKYLITGNVRADGSSKLHPDHRWGIFPSFSAAWRLSSEGFMEDIDWLDDLKIRGGWGQTGNQLGIDDYAYLGRYRILRQDWTIATNSDAVPRIEQTHLRTKDLTWETTTQTNIGLDLTILRNRLNFTMEYYYKYTTDLLMRAMVPPGANISGFIQRNEGVMENQGFEFAINTRNTTGEFLWNTNFNIAFNKNKLISLDLQTIYDDAETADQWHGMPIVRSIPGRPLGGFYGYISDGVDPETGDLMYRDSDESGKPNSTDVTFIGDPNPLFFYGLTNTFSYKNWNLSIFIQGTYGNDIFNASKMDTEGMFDMKNQSVNVLNRWRTPGQEKDVPRAGFAHQPSSYFVEDGSYLRVKDITLSYNVKSNFLNKMGVARLQPYFTMNNILTFTNYTGMDPEVNEFSRGNSGAVQGIDWGTYPHTRTFLIGVNVEF